MARGRQKQMSDAEAEDALNRTMVESGERDRLRAKLAQLLDEAGWREQVKLQVREGRGLLCRSPPTHPQKYGSLSVPLS